MRCSACGDDCRVVEVDFGAGFVEYWGAPFYDRQLADVSNCCEAPIQEEEYA